MSHRSPPQTKIPKSHFLVVEALLITQLTIHPKRRIASYDEILVLALLAFQMTFFLPNLENSTYLLQQLQFAIKHPTPKQIIIEDCIVIRFHVQPLC